VLSGAGFDGTEGLEAIKAQGGITFAQTPISAQYVDMPQNAISAEVRRFCSTSRKDCTRTARNSYEFSKPD
jgi:chemotaxis response regulator CheB